MEPLAEESGSTVTLALVGLESPQGSPDPSGTGHTSKGCQPGQCRRPAWEQTKSPGCRAS